ncbi:hypothetical protein Pyn_17483 [Prunus yedoensis var. nudiflora]|uniref:Uncharacterized protein n=1 Tax=Prunus yedoensis var. nudiflora TaxID=2094558 RepID=A0A314YD72_PRUYE|nr:hypothetical protein Pyn_17483 [Prunus yedoensis var. nudiflora]
MNLEGFATSRNLLSWISYISLGPRSIDNSRESNMGKLNDFHPKSFVNSSPRIRTGYDNEAIIRPANR